LASRDRASRGQGRGTTYGRSEPDREVTR
jgi:hypothetical protein